MKINDIILDRFLNNDLPKPQINKIKLLIKKDPKIKFRIEELKNFESTYEKEYKIAKKTKMPKSLYEKISIDQNVKKELIQNKSNNFYKIAASFIAFLSIVWIFTASETVLLSQNTSNYLNLLIISLLILIIFLILNKKK